MTGSADSVDGVWRALSGALRAFIARRVTNAADVEDVLQETFLAVHKGIGRVRDEERVTAWVYQVARSRIADLHRRARPMDLLEPERLAAEPADDGDDEEVRAEVATWLGPFVDTLPDTYREAVRLSELEGLPQREVARRLGLSLSGAKSRVQRGRALLLGMIEECCAMEVDVRGRVIGYEPRAGRCEGC